MALSRLWLTCWRMPATPSRWLPAACRPVREAAVGGGLALYIEIRSREKKKGCSCNGRARLHIVAQHCCNQGHAPRVQRSWRKLGYMHLASTKHSRACTQGSTRGRSFRVFG